MAIYFASDMHLDEKRPELFQAFFSFVEKHRDQMDALYLLGDLFEYWIGDDYIEPLAQKLILLINELVDSGIPCYIQYGNRDFMLGRKFFKICHATLLPDTYLIEFANERFVICHGDQLCTLDIEYQSNRKWLRNPVIKLIMRNLPLSTRLNLVAKMRNRSKKLFTNQDDAIFDVTLESSELLLNKFQANYLIHGHTHKPEKHLLPQGQERIVLGCWDESGGKIARLSPGGIELIDSNY